MIAKVFDAPLINPPFTHRVASVRKCGKATEPDNHPPNMRCVAAKARTKPNARPLGLNAEQLCVHFSHASRGL
jgi:hypothetical protein